MLKISEIKECLAPAVEMFKTVYPMVEVPEIMACSPERAEKVREQAVQECGAVNEKYNDSLAAEVIWGPMGTKILFYQSKAIDKDDVYHNVWHELGHVMFGRNTKYGIEIEENSPIFLGYNLLSEFMAEYIAYTVNEFKPLWYNEDINDRLIRALYDGKKIIQPYSLSMYLAMAMGNHDITKDELSQGGSYTSEDVWESILCIRRVISKQVAKENFWEPDIAFIEEIGDLYMELMYTLIWEKRMKGGKIG